MKIFAQLVRTTVNVALLPLAVVKDVATLGGHLIDDEAETVKAIRRIKEESDEDF